LLRYVINESYSWANGYTHRLLGDALKCIVIKGTPRRVFVTTGLEIFLPVICTKWWRCGPITCVHIFKTFSQLTVQKETTPFFFLIGQKQTIFKLFLSKCITLCFHLQLFVHFLVVHFIFQEIENRVLRPVLDLIGGVLLTINKDYHLKHLHFYWRSYKTTIKRIRWHKLQSFWNLDNVE
jgi:hypothetical protein